MKLIKNIQSEKIRAILTGSAIPAIDIMTAMGENSLSQLEKNEALEYFASRGGIHAIATMEHDFCLTQGL